VTAGGNPRARKRGLGTAVEAVIAEITKLSNPAKGEEEIFQVPTISSNNDKPTGDLFAASMEKASEDGVITTEKAKRVETTLDVAEGVQFDRCYSIGHSLAFPGLPGTLSTSCEDAGG
jgi:chaperonin GroEL